MSDEAQGSEDGPVWPEIRASGGLPRWLEANKVSLAFTSYSTGKLFLVGLNGQGGINIDQQYYKRAMGLCYGSGRLFLAAQNEIWELGQSSIVPASVQVPADLVLRPRACRVTGDIDVHEMALGEDGELVFVNTRYSCLAKLDPEHSFRPIWKPWFVSKLAGEDRCHLNGLGMLAGQPKYVTAVDRTDTFEGWRQNRITGGVILDVTQNSVIAEGFSMPHSPRAHGDHVLMLESGRGRLVEVDPATGAKRDLAFCPGFLRGLAIHEDHAIVTISKGREGGFKSLPIQEELRRREEAAWCGIMILSLGTGEVVAWIRFLTEIDELFDVIALPGVRCPLSLGLGTPELSTNISYEDAFTSPKVRARRSASIGRKRT